MADKGSTADIELEIEQARAALAISLDQLADKASPKRIVATTKANLIDRAKSPQGKKVIGGTVAGVVALLVVSRIRRRRHSS
ncbi:MAG: DUF3618 domain-containing protein [Jatrophihabitans sp.]